MDVPRAWCLVVLGAIPACLFETGERCGTHMHLGEADSCVCDEDSVVVAHRCEPCPGGELVVAGACACPDGAVRDPASQACVDEPPSQGLTCDASTPCGTTADPICAAGGYCTRTCATATDCVGGYACDLSPTPTCERPPSGLREPCTTQGDCAGFEASYCETTVGHVCMVAGCQVATDSCFVGYACCDLTSFGMPTLCVPEGMCPT